MLAISGGTSDGKIPLPQAVIDDVKKYQNFIPGLKATNLKPGFEMPLNQFLGMNKLLNNAKEKEIEGWRESEVGKNAVIKNGQKLQQNTFTGDTRPYAGLPVETDKMLSEAEKNRAEAGLANAKKNEANAPISNLTGEEYLKTLPTGQQLTVRAIGEGRQTLSPRQLATNQGKALAESVHQAYPDFDETKAKTWQKSNNEYRGSGATAKKVVSYNTALEHMQDLYNNTNSEGIFNPVSKAYQDRQVAMGYVANEVGNAIKNGVMSKEEGQKILADLGGGITPGNKRERIAETARLLHDKIEEYQNKFNESAPSSAVKVPLLISPRAAASYEFVQSGGKTLTQTEQKPQPQQTQGHKIGDIVVQNGQNFKVTAIDPTGKVTAAEAQ